MKAKTYAQLNKLVAEISKTEKKREVRESIRIKSKIVEEIKHLLKQYRTLAVVSMERLPSAESRRIYSRLSEYGIVKFYKNSLVLRALRDLGAKNFEGMSKYLTGSNIFIFTNMNPFELSKLLDEVVEYRFAEPGDKVDFDLELAPGPTDIKPGPSMSLFGKLKIPTQVREGVIWIAKDTKILRKGDQISSELSSLLRRLGIAVIPVRLQLKAVYGDGYIFSKEGLRIDYEVVRKDVLAAVTMSRVLAIELALPLPGVLPELIMRAYRVSIELAAAAGYVTAETLQELFTRAVKQALSVAQVLSGKVDLGIQVTTAVRETAEVPEEEKKEEEEDRRREKEFSEEEVSEAISSLFGSV